MEHAPVMQVIMMFQIPKHVELVHLLVKLVPELKLTALIAKANNLEPLATMHNFKSFRKYRQYGTF